MNITYEPLITLIRGYFPALQAIYLFGSVATGHQGPESDVDLGVLLGPRDAKAAGSLLGSELQCDLEALLGRKVDLLNLRLVPTVLQKEVISAECRIYEGDRYATEEFEMLTLSLYQKLNEERKEIVAGALAEGGRFHRI